MLDYKAAFFSVGVGKIVVLKVQGRNLGLNEGSRIDVFFLFHFDLSLFLVLKR